MRMTSKKAREFLTEMAESVDGRRRLSPDFCRSLIRWIDKHEARYKKLFHDHRMLREAFVAEHGTSKSRATSKLTTPERRLAEAIKRYNDEVSRASTNG